MGVLIVHITIRAGWVWDVIWNCCPVPVCSSCSQQLLCGSHCAVSEGWWGVWKEKPGNQGEDLVLWICSHIERQFHSGSLGKCMITNRGGWYGPNHISYISEYLYILWYSNCPVNSINKWFKKTENLLIHICFLLFGTSIQTKPTPLSSNLLK